MPEPLVLLHGEDRYLVTEAAVALRTQLVEEMGSDLGLEEFRDLSDGDAIERSLASPPFLALRRVVVLWDPQIGPRGTRETEDVLRAISRRADSTAVLVVVRAVVPATNNLHRGLRELGAEVRLVPRPKGAALRHHVDQRVRSRGLNLAAQLSPRLLELAADSLGRLEMELDKLALYPERPGELISEEAGSRLLTPVPPRELYRLTDAIFDAPGRVGGLLSGLMSRPEVPPQLVVGALARALRDLISMADVGMGAVPSWKAERMSRQLRRAGAPRLQRWLVALADLDWEIRVGRLDAVQGLETLLAHMAGELSP
ncbi:MAG: DNA polymerase III subunit delta, partial [Candidatus Dormibacteria bacterium]